MSAPLAHRMGATAGHLAGRVCMVTGATGALGTATANAFARRGAKVVLVSRDEARGRAAVASVRQASGAGSVDLLLADLSSLPSVRNLAKSFGERHDRLDVLVNAAAVFTRKRIETAEGFELTFATNFLGPFLLTNLLVPALRSAAPSRVITISAPTTTELDFADLQGRVSWRPLHAFGASKMADLLFTYALARRLEGTEVQANVLHPGLMKSDLMRELAAPARFFVRLASKPPERAAEAVAHLASAPDLEGITGRFFKGTQLSESNAYSRNREVQERLWDESERLVAESFPRV
jgi:NAD(P)-dependent dehydrogenase (short-subunit alcohol dehydrogenase family)